MASKLTIAILFSCVIFISGCSVLFEKPLVATVTQEPLHHGIEIDKSIKAMRSIAEASFRKGVLRKELSYENSNLKRYFEQTQGNFDINNIRMLEQERRFYKAYPAVSNLKIPNESLAVYRLAYRNILHTASFTRDAKSLRLFGNFILVLAGQNNKTKLYVFGDKLRVKEGFGCSMHGLNCGKNSLYLDSAPLEQERILMFLSDRLTAANIPFTWF